MRSIFIAAPQIKMKKNLFRAFLLWLAFLIAMPANAYGIEDAGFGPMTTEYDGYLIAMSDGVVPNTASLECIAPDVYLTEDEEFANELLDTGYADYIEPNYTISLFSLAEDANWPFEAVGGSDAASLGLNGNGVRIAVIDSGVDKENVNLTGVKFLDGYDYLKHTSDMIDTVGHGTYVCQVIAGSGDLGVRGIAREADLVPLRCFSATDGSVSDIIAAVYDAVDVYHCDIINMSWGMEEDSVFLNDALKYAFDAGTILVAAAGNVDRKAAQGTIFYPAAYQEVIGVGSVDQSLSISDASQQTEAVFACAPGEGIVMASLSGVLSSQSGTSFAAPYVSAELALLKQLDSNLNAESTFSLLQERSVDLGEEGYDVSYGYGFAEITELLGQSWCQVERGETALKLTGWLRNANGGCVISAMYEESGKMLDCALTGFETSISGFEFTYETEAAEIKLFFVDQYFAPLTKHMVFSLEEK